MTQRQLVEEFKNYPKTKQFEIVCELGKIYEEDLIKHLKSGHKLSAEEESIINRLREIGAIGLENRLTENS